MRVRTYRLSILLLLSVSLGAACQRHEAEPARFANDLDGEKTPWTHTDFDNADDKFTFALFSDLTGGEREGVFEVAVAQLSLLRPEFLISVGDLIEGGTEDTDQLRKEWDWFDERATRSRAPVFRVGGNHDLTNLVMREFWEQRFGARYYHFVYRDVLFLVLDTEDNSPERMQEIFLARAEAIRRVDAEGWDVFGETEYASMPEQLAGTIGPEQSAYFQDVIRRNPQVRWTFLFMHKAPWERVGEENFKAIEDALADQPYTVFHGHTHTYVHQLRNGRDYIRLGTTGGVQFVEESLSIDHVTLVTVDDSGVDIANIRMSGIFDKTGAIPANGDALCFDAARCGEEAEITALPEDTP